MARISLAGFRDPIRRPRYIVWTGVVVLFLAAFIVMAMGVTSSRWFCADGCHKVQDDTIIAYTHASHNHIACVTCHMPVNPDPITFVIHKIEGGLGVIPTVRNTYELPLNEGSKAALSHKEFPSAICEECHNMATRKVTPSPGIIINHEVHAKADITCTTCHNRTAHKEDFTLTLPGNKKHDDFMLMTACYRCHSLEPGAKAPGTCPTCHTKDFPLKPENHLQADFYPKGHAELARQDAERIAEAKAEAAAAGTSEGEGGESTLPKVASVSYCSTCHVKASFCDKCHGMTIPHPAEFKEPKDAKDPAGHPAMSKNKATAAKCEFCHHQSKTKFCDSCHHGSSVKWTFDTKQAWQQQHAKAVDANGVEGCLGKCHEASFCKDCHDRLKPLPTSHKDPKWLHAQRTVSQGKLGTAKASAAHVAAYTKSPSACAVCHGEGGPKAAFCKGCHKVDMPHPSEFTKFHSATGRATPAVCGNCHQLRELCSDCHHVGATPSTPWVNQHPKTVDKAGSAQCFEKCHKKDFCVACHTRTNAVPASHRASSWLHGTVKVRATHTTVYNTAPDSCTFCHGDGGTKSKFCSNCHKMEMPHPTSFGPKVGTDPTKDNGGDHAKLAQTGKLNRAACANCHNTAQFCDSCHHKGGYKAGQVWGVGKVGVPQTHPSVVKKSGTEPCFACHKETYCSYCHVRASR
jgi:hypothetical protein